MQQEIRFATFNVFNLAPPGVQLYENLAPLTHEEYEAKADWTAQQLDQLDADVVAFQEIFSQAALRDVLSRTRKYKDAIHAGFDPDPHATRLTPNVALVSRLPLADNAMTYSTLPHNLSIHLPGVAEPVTRFTRPVLHAQIVVSKNLRINIFVVHLKSKRPDLRAGESEDDQGQLSIAALRSLIRRGMEAVGLRCLLTDAMKGNGIPVVVLGDFNDIAAAVSTQLVMGLGQLCQNGRDNRLFETYRIQPRRDPLRNVGYTHVHNGTYEAVDHILVSEEFNPASPLAIGEVLDVEYLNDHIPLRQPEASDHGAVMARIQLYGS